MNHPSLRKRLLIGLVAAISLIWGATAVLSYQDAHDEIDELFDAQLSREAKVLLAQAEDELEEEVKKHGHRKLETVEEQGGHKYEQKISFQIWDGHGNLLLRSASAPLTPLTSHADGFENTVDAEGHKWRVFSRWDRKHQLQVQAGQREDVREELAGDVALHLLYPMFFALPLLALLIWFGIGRGLAPLRRIADEVAQRAPQKLKPLETDGVPQEVRPLADALNALLLRLADALENERRFTADAAHELRTPLAALKTQAQVALRAEDGAMRQHALEQVVLGVDRATHLVEQMLTLARLDPQSAAARHETLDLAAQVERDLAPLGTAALEKGIDLSLEAAGPAPVNGDAAMLGVLLRNLVDNAIRYTPPGGAVQVMVHVQKGQTVLQVTDTGPGIPPEEREQVLKRFYRGLGTGESGSGLGLSIVKRIADLHGAEVRLETPEGGAGLRVKVVFGTGAAR